MTGYRTFLSVGLLCSLVLTMLTGCPGLLPPVVLEITNITTNTTLSAGTYIAESDVNVSGGATLTLKPGVTIKFASGKVMSIRNDGRLSAVGTAENPIMLTGSEATRGYWGGLRIFESNSADNRLEFVTIEYGGGYWEANLYVAGSSSAPGRVAVANCTLRESGKFGFKFDTDSVVSPFTENTITLNESGAGSAAAPSVNFLDSASTYAGNVKDIVQVTGSSVDTDTTFPSVDAAYVMTSSLGVHAKLTLQAGTRLQFDSGEDMSVYSDGSLSAVGTSAKPIVLTGGEAVRGYWGGLHFTESNSAFNRLENVVIEYGGGYWNANLYVTGSSNLPTRIAIKNCTFRQSKDCGFQLDFNSNVTEFSGNRSTGNQVGAARVDLEAVGLLNSSGPYSGNDNDVILVQGNTLNEDATWAVADADYQLLRSVRVNSNLVIGAGARLVFPAGEEMTIASTGKLTAVGTAQSPIVFTGLQQSAGFWGGLRFDNITVPGSALSFVTIEYGGGYWDANLYLAGAWAAQNSLSVQNCHFASSGSWGIKVDSPLDINVDVVTANTFASNVDGTIMGL